MHPYEKTMSKKREQRDAAVNGNKIRWSDDEADRVARVAYRLLAESMEEPLSSFEAVKRAQMEVLPPHRHRVIRQAKDLEKTIIPIWKAIKADEEKTQRAPDAPAVDPILAPGEADASPSSTEQPAPPPESLQIDAMQPATTGPDDEPDEHEDDGADATPQDRRQMVRWTDAERMIVARESKRLLYGFSDMSSLDAIRKAVFGFLPEARQREIHTLGEVKWIHPLWQQIETERLAEEAMQQAEDAQKEAARLAKEQAAHAALDPLSLPLDTLVKAIGVKIGQQLISAIGEHLQDAIMDRLTASLQHLPGRPEGPARLHVVPAAPRNHLPRVTVVGLLNQQAQDVERHFAEAVEFKFIKSSGTGGSGAHGGAGMLARGSNADVVISMTSFTGHDVDEAAKHLNVPFVRLTGSVSALKRWLTSWLNGELTPLAAHS